MSKIKPDGWVVRDKGGALMFCRIMPTRRKTIWMIVGEFRLLTKDHPLGKDLTWDDDPRKVSLVSTEQFGRLVVAAENVLICDGNNSGICEKQLKQAPELFKPGDKP